MPSQCCQFVLSLYMSTLCRLTDSSSSMRIPTEHKEPMKRAEPTEEAKIAGQAALARLEAKKSDKPRFNTYVIVKIISIYYYICVIL